MISTKNFWPWEYDHEEEIYENLTWDLPGFRPVRGVKPIHKSRRKAGHPGGNL
jgi:hypothetical protein